MRKLLLFSLLIICSAQLSAQAFVKGTGVRYDRGVPTVAPDTTYGTELVYDLTNRVLYMWDRTNEAWVKQLNVTRAGGVPSGDPGNGPEMYVNTSTEDLYWWSGSGWDQLNSLSGSGDVTQSQLDDSTAAIRADFPVVPTIDGSETKINAGTNTTVTGTGTIADPYVLNSTASGGSSAGLSVLDTTFTANYTASTDSLVNRLTSVTESNDIVITLPTPIKSTSPYTYQVNQIDRNGDGLGFTLVQVDGVDHDFILEGDSSQFISLTPDANEQIDFETIFLDGSYRWKATRSLRRAYEVETYAEIYNGNFAINDRVLLKAGLNGVECVFEILASPLTGYTSDSIAVIPTKNSLYAHLEIPTTGIDIKTFGAKDVADYFIRKNPIPPATPAAGDYSDVAFEQAIKYLNAQTTLNDKTNPRRLLIQGQYYIDTLTLTPSNGVELWCEGNSYIHKNGRDTAVLIRDHYGMKHRINVSHRTWDGTTTRDWYPKNTETLPEDSTSVGIQITNSRNNIIEASALKFMDGFRMQGDADGVVNNIIYPLDISNNRFNVIDRNINGGWANQNTFIGGKIKGTGLPGRNYSVDIDCGFVWLNNADNTTFIGVNMEGSSAYKYAIYNDGAANVFQNVRLEGLKANQIFIDNNARSNTIISGYEGFVLFGLYEFGTYYSSDGTTANIPKNPDGTNATGSFFVDEKNAPTYLAAESLHLPGSDNFGNVSYNTTLNLATKNATSASRILAANRNEKLVLELLGDGELNYYGPLGQSKHQFFTDRGQYDTTTYAINNWISKDKFIIDGGSLYWARKAFKANGTISTDVAANNLALVTGEYKPTVKFRDNGADFEQIGGIEDTSGVTFPPEFIDSYALEVETAISTSSTTYSLPISEKAIAKVNHTVPNSTCTVTFDMTNIPEGTIFALTNGIDNGSILKVAAGGVVKSKTGETEILIGYRQIVYFQFAYGNIIQETHRTTNGIRSVGTTAQRPTLSSEYTDYLYFDTSLNKYIRWSGASWNVSSSENGFFSTENSGSSIPSGMSAVLADSLILSAGFLKLSSSTDANLLTIKRDISSDSLVFKRDFGAGGGFQLMYEGLGFANRTIFDASGVNVRYGAGFTNFYIDTDLTTPSAGVNEKTLVWDATTKQVRAAASQVLIPATEVSTATTAVIGTELPVNTTSGAVSITPPASPSIGQRFAVFDSRSQAGSNNITILTTSQTLSGAAENHVISVTRGYAEFKWYGGSIGWRVYE